MLQPHNDETLTLTFVTPEMAQSWLDADGRTNRVLNEKKVRMYAEEIESGLFVTSMGCSIMFDREGLNIDGQHRLSAIVKTGKGQWIYILRNVDRARVMRVVDRGGRTLANVFEIEGVPSARDICSMASSAVTGGREGVQPSPSAVESFVRANYDKLTPFVRICKIKGATSPMAAAFAMCHSKGYNGVPEAAARFVSGEFPQGSKDPIWHLNQRRVNLIGGAKGNESAPTGSYEFRAYKFRLAVQALRMVHEGIVHKLQDVKDAKNFSY